MDRIIGLAVPVGIIILAFVAIGLVLARLYRRATKEVALVKTGAGGRKVVMDGGLIVLPLLHEVARVNMNTLRLSVTRAGNQALITKDRMRVDVTCEFYVKVKATDEGVSTAAQTLGDKTFNAEQLRDMVEGKLVDVLRAVAAQMTMDSLHENRSDFSQQVQQAAAEGLLKNGLELEGAALTGLDQTPFDKLDQDNAFNAVGMKQLAEVIAESKRRRAEIEAETEIAVAQTKLGAAQRQLEISKQEEQTRIEQSIEIETLKANETAEIAQRREEGLQRSEAARIVREQAIRTAEIDQTKAIELAEQDRKIAISEKSEAESKARAAADAARAEAVVAEQAIETNRTVAVAERQKRIAILSAQEAAERDATRVRVEAAAEREAAADRAAAMRELAEAEAAQITIRAEATRTEKLAEAEGQTALIAAENALSPEIIALKTTLARLEALPAIIAEMVRPAEKISEIRINQVTGLGGGTGGNGAAAANGQGGSLVDQAVGAIGAMALQHPMLKAIGESAGLTLGDGLNGILADVGAAKAVPATGTIEIPATDATA